MKITSIIIGIVLVLISGQVKSQVVPELHFQLSIPTGDFRNFVEKPGLMGFGLQFRKYLPDNRLSLGGGLSWFYFPDKKGKRTLELQGDDGTYTGYVTNFSNIYGLEALAQYDLKDRSEKLVPFVKAGVGAAYQNQRQDIGLLAFRYRGFQFLTHAEAGMKIQLAREGSLNLSLTYHMLPGSGDVSSTSFAGLRIGYAGFRIR
ncbi:hypothetical protein [Flavihumibacter sp. UBA7668]|uniref:hypothetical protein n=1 Tax=Flavihumibacter sp. UBA7668 TaxID=1946542 RepID=UPI0025C0E56C|nr:hypothetical protein [Flavihumibacter sp. UBA7668]